MDEAIYNIGMKKKVIWTAVTVLYLFFIFSRSMKAGPESSKESMGVVEVLQYIVDTSGINVTVSEYAVRKCAHFGEYAVFGLLLVNTVNSYGVVLGRLLWMVPCIGGLSAAADEGLQLFQTGRSAQGSDVLLDLCGVLAGAAVMLLSRLTRGRA